VAQRATRAAPPPTGDSRQVIGEVAPRVGCTVASESRSATNRRACFNAALRREEQRGSGTDERADEESSPEESDVLPVDRASVRRAARAVDNRAIFVASSELPLAVGEFF
jgi:hypothetical protein